MPKKEVIEAYALKNAVNHNGKADQGAVLKSLFNEGLEKKEIPKVIPELLEIIENVNAMTLHEQEKKLEELIYKPKEREIREGLAELEQAEDKKVVVRFSPFPSGPLHIGNARQAILNDEYAKKYHGKLILVIDDTIGSEEKPIDPDAYKLIKEGLDWLKVKYDKKIIYKSDRLELYYKYAEELIKKGWLYVCDCSQEKFHELKVKGVECPCRNLSEDKHLERWRKMLSKESKPGDLVVRLKTNMADPNPAFRDRVMFRISDKKHPRVERKYKVWPLLEFSWAIDDHLLKITHIIRGIDLQMESLVEKFIWDIFQWEAPEIIHTGFLAIQGIKISKSKGAQEVRSGHYIGWNDPRTWSLQSLRDRGILPEAIREFILKMGLTKSNSTVAIEVLYALNRIFLEKAPRYFFVPNPIKIKINLCPELTAKIPMHPSEKIGQKIYKTSQEFYISKQDLEFMEDKNYRLMYLLNFKSFHPQPGKPREFSFISEHPDKSLNTHPIQWVSADSELKPVKIEVRMQDNSLVSGYGEPALLKLKKNSQIQFERFSFVKLYKIDKKKNQAEFWFTHP